MLPGSAGRNLNVAMRASLVAATLCGAAACTSGDRTVDPRHTLVVEYTPVPLDDEVNEATGTCATAVNALFQ
jgi:hypothetical protein